MILLKSLHRRIFNLSASGVEKSFLWAQTFCTPLGWLRLSELIAASPLRWAKEKLRGNKKTFSVKRRKIISEGGGLVRISTRKAIQCKGPGHSVNRRTLKVEKLLSSSPSRKSALLTTSEELETARRLCKSNLHVGRPWGIGGRG